MTRYAIYFNQQWVGDHPAEWFQTRQEPSRAVVREMEEAGVLVFAGGLVEDPAEAFSADATSGTLSITDGPYTETAEHLGGITVIDVPDLRRPRCGPAGWRRGAGGPRRSGPSGESISAEDHQDARQGASRTDPVGPREATQLVRIRGTGPRQLRELGRRITRAIRDDEGWQPSA